MVHPREKVVLPFAPEPITKDDGDTKNDCERNAAKRLLPRIRTEHPHLKCIVVEDALAPNAPHLKMLKDNKFRFVIGIKPAANKWIFDWVQQHDEVSTYGYKDTIKGKKVILRYLNTIPLNKGSENILVNYIESDLPHENECKIRCSVYGAWVTGDFSIKRCTQGTLKRFLT